jgi:acetolactate decarboxylase
VDQVTAVETLREEELHAQREPHVLFQASTIGALLEGAYDGDLTFAELAEHGDLGLGTLNGLDGEMIALDGRFYRADVDGNVGEVGAETRTPFAVVSPFEPTIDVARDGPLDHDALLAWLDQLTPAGVGTMLGFRFPDYVEGIEVSGYHLHFISADRSCGGHVLGCRCDGTVRARIDVSGELRVELPPGVELADPDLASGTRAAVELVERAG